MDHYSNGRMWDEYDKALSRIAELEEENEALKNKVDKAKDFLETVSLWLWKRQGQPLPQWCDEFNDVCEMIELKGGE